MTRTSQERNEAADYLNVPLRRLLHPNPISPPHIPHLIPPPNCPPKPSSRSEQHSSPEHLADLLHEHQHSRQSTDAYAPPNAQNQHLRRARERSRRARVEALEKAVL